MAGVVLGGREAVAGAVLGGREAVAGVVLGGREAVDGAVLGGREGASRCLDSGFSEATANQVKYITKFNNNEEMNASCTY